MTRAAANGTGRAAMNATAQGEIPPRATTAGNTASGRGGVSGALRRLLPQSYLILVLVLIVIVGALVSPNFLTVRNFSNVVSFSSIVAILAVGQFYVIVTGGIDLSVGAILALATVVVALTLQTGVDPDKQGEMRDLMKSEIARLLSEPPSEAEFAEAKRHLIGRRISAAQSNDEIAESLSLEWLAFGALRSVDDFAATVNAVTLDDMKAVLPAFVKGDIVTVTVGE